MKGEVSSVSVSIPEAGTEFENNGIYGLLIAKPASVWIEEASLRAIPKQLFYELWFEGEMCILFATSGAGKSILACQIGDELSKREKVIYLDCELSDKQFQLRYTSSTGELYQFNENFIRLQINRKADKPEKITEEDFLINSVEECLTNTGARILIVDNITYLRSDTEKSKDALPLMKKLNELKERYNLSILILAHTPKRDATKPVTDNDLFGSVMQKNFCDSMFAIGVSTTDGSLRYLKQLKERSTEKIYHEDNVIVYQIEKKDRFLGFTFLGYGKEADYLKVATENEKQMIKEMVQQRHREGKSYREIGKEFNISPAKVGRIINKIR